MNLTDEFLRKIWADHRPTRALASEYGVPVRTIQRWRYRANKRFGDGSRKGLRPGWSRCPACGQSTPPSADA